jgi:hypothetical protein
MTKGPIIKSIIYPDTILSFCAAIAGFRPWSAQKKFSKLLAVTPLIISTNVKEQQFSLLFHPLFGYNNIINKESN